MLVKVSLEHQRGIAIALVGIVLFVAIEGVLMVQRT